jgi:hypothetical protein
MSEHGTSRSIPQEHFYKIWKIVDAAPDRWLDAASKMEVMMTEYKIESVAVAPRKYAKNRYPFHLMVVGQSFELADDSLREYQRVHTSANNFSKNHPPMKFVVRSPGRGKIYRCWRIS